MNDTLKRALESGELRPLDYHFACRLGRRAAQRNPEFELAAALLSRQVGDGHTCTDLEALSSGPLFHDRDGSPFGVPPGLGRWLESLRANPCVGEPGTWAPITLDKMRLYLTRYWRYEHELAMALLARASQWLVVDRASLRDDLARLFPTTEHEPDWQRIAAAIAVLRPFSVISGGPGTGKTRTVAAILALLLRQCPNLQVALCAPTGKAAVRLSESIGRAKGELAVDADRRDGLPEETTTIHRLLGARPGRSQFRHNAENPIAADLVVVDEASMVDLPLMAKLTQALRPSARLILLGDKDQLASVEAGSVLADICASAAFGYSPAQCVALAEVAGAEIQSAPNASPLADNIVLLRRSFRFAERSAIDVLARAVKQGARDAVLDALSAQTDGGVIWRTPGRSDLSVLISARAVSIYRECLRASNAVEALDIFDRFRVLCALRDGPWGVTGINRTIEQALRREGLVAGSGANYHGRPVMVTQNDPALGLFNGDVGLLMSDSHRDGPLRGYFRVPGIGIRKIHPGRLPAHATAFATTVHKSQGSEFDRVLLVLPERDMRVVTRELLYTGITRARDTVEIWAPRDVLLRGVDRSVARGSGLAERLQLTDPTTTDFSPP